MLNQSGSSLARYPFITGASPPSTPATRHLAENVKKSLQNQQKKFHELISEDNSAKRLRLINLNINDSIAVEISRALSLNQSLTDLSLSNNQIGEEGTVALANAIKNNFVLKIFKMDDNDIGDKGAIAMGESIAYHPSLKILHLNKCKIGLVGVKSLLQSLKTNRSLESLGISHSVVGKEGSTYVSEFLTQNQKLRSINLGFSGIEDSDALNIAKGIQANPNTNIQAIILDGNDSIQPSTFQFIREVISDAAINRHCRDQETSDGSIQPQVPTPNNATKIAKPKKFRDYLRGALLSHKRQKGALDKSTLDPSKDPEIIAKREKLQKIQELLLEKDNRMKEKKEQLSSKEKELEKEEKRMEERERALKAKIKAAKTHEKTLKRLNKKNGTTEETEDKIEEEEETVTAIAVGDSGVGKTSLLEAYAIHMGITSRAEEDMLDPSEKKFRTFSIPQKKSVDIPNNESAISKVKPNVSSVSTTSRVTNRTVESTNANLLISDPNVTLQLVDTETEDSFLRFRALNYKVADVFLLIFSISDRNSFVNAAYEWYEELEFNQPNVPILLVGTKSDLRNPNESSENPESCVSFAQGESLAAEIHAVGYYEVSVFQEKSLEILFDSIVHLHRLSQAHKWTSSDALNIPPSLPSASTDAHESPSAIPSSASVSAATESSSEKTPRTTNDPQHRSGKRRELMNKFGFKSKKDRKEKKKEQKEKGSRSEEEEEALDDSEELKIPVPPSTPFLMNSPPTAVASLPTINIPSIVEDEMVITEDSVERKRDGEFNPSKSADLPNSKTRASYHENNQITDGLTVPPAIIKSKSSTDIKQENGKKDKKEKKEKKERRHSYHPSEEDKEKERRKEEDWNREREHNQSLLKEKDELIERLKKQLDDEKNDRGTYLIKDKEELEEERKEVQKERDRLLGERRRIQSEERESLAVIQAERRKMKEELKNKSWDIRRKEGRMEEQKDKLMSLRRNLDERWHILLMREGGGELGDERKRLEHERQLLDDEKSEFEETRMRWEQERDDEEEELEAITEELSEREEKLFRDRIKLKSRRRELDERVAECAKSIEEQRKIVEAEKNALLKERIGLEKLKKQTQGNK